MKSNGGEDDSVVDIAGYIPPEDLYRSYGEQIKLLAKTFDDSVSDETKMYQLHFKTLNLS